MDLGDAGIFTSQHPAFYWGVRQGLISYSTTISIIPHDDKNSHSSNLQYSLWDYYPHFSDEDTEDQRGQQNHLKKSEVLKLRPV
jgi:hypothetical protein